MIDIALLRTNPDVVRHICRARRADVDLDRLITLDTALRRSLVRADNLSDQLKHLKDDGQAACDLTAKLQLVTDEVRTLQEERDALWARVPNLFPDDTPLGEEDEDNVELRRVGETVPADEARAHDSIGTRLGILDIARGAEVAGPGFYYWKGDGARLAWAMFSYAQDLLIRCGFVPVLPPVLARERTFFGTGYLPFFADQLYRIADSDLALIGTSEQTLIGYYGDSFVAKEDLPILLTAFSPCFRTEAGVRASRGGYRVHQFHKVEQIVICNPADSEYWLEECQRNVEALLTGLELPYRVSRVCLGDMGAPAYKKYDTDTWFPSFGSYRETHSNTNLIDYQTRRFGIRFRNADGDPLFPHTISSTGITDRAALAILENHLLPDGTVAVPEALQPYLGGLERLGLGKQANIGVSDSTRQLLGSLLTKT